MWVHEPSGLYKTLNTKPETLNPKTLNPKLSELVVNIEVQNSPKTLYSMVFGPTSLEV